MRKRFKEKKTKYVNHENLWCSLPETEIGEENQWINLLENIGRMVQKRKEKKRTGSSIKIELSKIFGRSYGRSRGKMKIKIKNEKRDGVEDKENKKK